MTAKSLRRAGCIAMVSAVLSIPFLLISYTFVGDDSISARAVMSSMQTVGLVLFVYLITSLKNLLHSRLAFRGADNYVDFMITTNVIFSVAMITSQYLNAWQDALEQFSLLLIIAFGVAQVLFGVKLFQVPGSAGGRFRAYAIFSITTGALLATVKLLDLAVITGAISDVMLGSIFFGAARSPREFEAVDDNGL